MKAVWALLVIGAVPSAHASVTCTLVEKTLNKFNCKDTEGRVASGNVSDEEWADIRVSSAMLTAGINGGGWSDSVATVGELSIPVAFGSPERLALLRPQAIYYGYSNQKGPAPIDATLLSGRYIDKGMNAKNALILAESALKTLMQLPERHALKPGTYYGGQSLFATQFTTDDPVVLFGGDDDVAGIVGGTLPGTDGVNASKASGGLAGIKIRKGNSGIYVQAAGSESWRYFRAENRARYEYQVGEDPEDKSTANLPIVADSADVAYFEGGVVVDGIHYYYFIVVDVKTGAVIKTHATCIRDFRK